jgi:hypothetical protein
MLAFAAAALCACGGGPTSTASSSPPPVGGAPTAPTGPSGTTGPAGTSGPAGPAAPAPATPAAPPNPTPAPTPTAPPTPTTSPTACDGLLPDAPGPGVALRRADSTGGGFAFCEDPITDGHGDWIGVGVGYKFLNYGFVSAASPSQGGGGFQVPKMLTTGGGLLIAPQPDGYHALRGGDYPGWLQRFDAQGALLGEDLSLKSWLIAGVPSGGSVLVNLEGWPGPTIVNHVVWLDAGGRRRADAVVPGVDPWIVVSSEGDVLVFAAGRARWYDRNGAPTTDWFSYGFDGQRTWRPDTVLAGGVALADGSVVVGLGTDRPLRFEAGAAAAAPPPDWVTSRAGARIAAVRGNRANAFATVTSAPASACEIRLEILTPDGRSCGTTTLGSPDPCTRVTFGADRTVFTMAQQPVSDCVWHWWTGLLR